MRTTHLRHHRIPFVVTVLAFAFQPLAAQKQNEESAQKSARKPRIEVCFVLDTTGSMGGLIEGAKTKIWAIANELIAAKPTPDLSLGLVGYRDRGDEYVVKSTPLTDDIDAIYAELTKFEAAGGGDEPESVNEALRTAIREMKWSSADDVLKIIFLVGDAPPHMDYEQDVKYPQLCEEAVKKGLIINTVQCGSIEATTPIWKEIAQRSEGEFTKLEQSGNMTVMTTPIDARLAELNEELGKTIIPYGDAETRSSVYAKQAAAVAAPASVSSERLKFNKAKRKVVQGKGELIDALETGEAKLEDLRVDDLPEDLRGLDEKELAAEVENRRARREELQKEIARLSHERESYIAEQKSIAAKKGEKADAFDEEIARIVRAQAARNGISY
jgi:Mg-chelatase subunit ChlD